MFLAAVCCSGRKTVVTIEGNQDPRNKRNMCSCAFGFKDQDAKRVFIVYHCQRCPMKLNEVVFSCKPKTGLMKPEFDKQLTCVDCGGLAIWSTGSFPGGPLYNVGRPFA